MIALVFIFGISKRILGANIAKPVSNGFVKYEVSDVEKYGISLSEIEVVGV